MVTEIMICGKCKEEISDETMYAHSLFCDFTYVLITGKNDEKHN